MIEQTSLQQYLQSAFLERPWSTDEVIEFVLPLFEEVLSFHDAGMVGSLERFDTVILTDGRLDIDENFTHFPVNNISKVMKLLDYETVRGFQVRGRLEIHDDVSTESIKVVNLEIADAGLPLKTAAYLPGYNCFELVVDHHDAQTDIFILGLILGSVVMGLDLYDKEDLENFVRYREQPVGLNDRIHPTIAGLVTEMTELDRRNRSRDLREIIGRLRFYRDYNPERQKDLSKLAAFAVKKPKDRNQFILGRLRNRLFDTSRRNRLLYYKSNTRFVNLTVSSVPIVVHFQSINSQLLFTWNNEISKLIIGQKDISLNKFLRFEDHPYLNSQLNAIRQDSDKDEKEFGFSQLKLVVAFLRWHNLKESPLERIESPLLLIPVKVNRKKALKEEQFTVEILDNAALVNPILSNHLKDLYGIELPETIDFDEVTMEQFFQLLKEKIDQAKQGVKLTYVLEPRIKLIHNIAKQTVNTYRKRLKQRENRTVRHMDYSYSDDHFKPLGLEIFRAKVEPRQSSLEFLLTAIPNDPGPLRLTEENPVTDSTLKTKTMFELADSENNPYSWEFDVCNMVLGNFNYKKMSLVSDYNKVAKDEISHPVFEEIFSNTARPAREQSTPNNPEEWYHVITADPTQSRAILEARAGKSYIIQGPPGTGKSQTITNLIADFLAREKTVLFVCEKRAALDVVYHRLQQNGLAELCSYIHDSQSDKKEVIRNLKTVYDDFLKNQMDLKQIQNDRDRAMSFLLSKIDILSNYHQLLRMTDTHAGVPTRNLIERVIELQTQAPKNLQSEAPDYSEWLSSGHVITELGKELEESGASSSLAEHPFANLSPELVRAENPISQLNLIGISILESLTELGRLIQERQIPAEHASRLEQIQNLVDDSVVLEELAASGNLKLVDKRNEHALVFEKKYRSYLGLKEDAELKKEKNARWSSKFERGEVEQALALAKAKEQSFFRFLNRDWRELKKQMEISYDFSAHNIRPTFVTLLNQLQDEYQAEGLASAERKKIQNDYHISNPEMTQVAIDVMRRKQGDKEIDYLLQHHNADELVLQLSKLSNKLDQLNLKLKQVLLQVNDRSPNQLKDELATIQSNTNVLKELLPVLRKFSEVPVDLQQYIREQVVSPVQAEACMAISTLEAIWNKNRLVAGTTQLHLAEAAKEIEHAYQKLLDLNSLYIRSRWRSQFKKHYDLSNSSVVGMDMKDRELKKQYAEGRRILEHEMTKTMRYKSIRELASNESGMVLRDIKPVWLMSPLSVSDSLPLDSSFFDVVIFDEASQITLEEGIPALFRAPQAIIVGDDKQMPPSNFFNTKSEDPEDLEMIEGELEDEILSDDSDSLLVQGSRKLNSTMLSWHYRSRYETLISYSNHAFYGGGLLTIPDRSIHHRQRPLLEVKAVTEGPANSTVLLRDSISFHYLTCSVYENRTNSAEAGYIAEMVRTTLLKKVPDTIGIVAFSQEQQIVIEEAINALAELDKPFEDLLEQAYNRKDDGQFTGLFIKNLENVQGDERDIIIMSICYGPDPHGKMLMNFGPINRKGGEKRLNVIFSRARKHMAVVSSIRHDKITNIHNEGANYLRRFLQYAELVSTGEMETARTVLDSLAPRKETEGAPISRLVIVGGQIRLALESEGYLTDAGIGQSGFKCSIGVKRNADDQSYCLGILIDDEQHYRNDDLVEQYQQRPAILRAFGWKVVNVFGQDWLKDREGVMKNILNQLKETTDIQPEDILPPGRIDLGQSQAIPERGNGEVASAGPSSPEITLVKDKLFWEVTKKGLTLELRTGRIGAQGLVQIKTFDTPEQLEVEFTMMVSKPKENGYALPEQTT